MNTLQQQLERFNVHLTTAQLTQLVIGVTVAVVVYAIFKGWQWYRRRERNPAAPRMRPRSVAKSTPSSRQTKGSAPPPGEYLKTTQAVTTREPEAIAAPVTKETFASIVPLGSSVSTTSVEANLPEAPRMAYGSGTFWPVEPKTVEKRRLFDEPGEEYPWADGSDYAFGAATPAISEMLPTTDEGRRAMTKSLRNAGYYTPHAWQNFASVRYLGIVLPILFFGTLLVVVPEQLETLMIAGIVIGPIVGWALPALYVRGKATTRLREIENSMPDMLDLLNMCVSQGMNVPSSLRRVGRDIAPVYPALSKELAIVAEQARVGHLTEALENLSDRVDTPEVHSFSSLLIQTERMGTSVSEALSEYSDSMREAQKQRADQKANAATFKLLFPTVLCLMPAVFLFLAGPSLIELNKFFSGGGIDGLSRQATEVIEQQR